MVARTGTKGGSDFSQDQEQVQSCRFLTKYLSKDEIEHIVDYMQHAFMEGRSDVAPELSLLDDNSSGIVHEWHEDVLHGDGASVRQRQYTSMNSDIPLRPDRHPRERAPAYVGQTSTPCHSGHGPTP